MKSNLRNPWPKHLFSGVVFVTATALVVASLTLSAPALAVTIVECVDASGNVSMRDKCPPGMTKKGEKVLRGLGGKKLTPVEEVAAAKPLVLYTVPSCDACDLVRNLLSNEGYPFTEKDVQDNAEIQQELEEVAGGLTVPALLVGDQRPLTGYSRSAILAALSQAGYPTPEE